MDGSEGHLTTEALAAHIDGRLTGEHRTELLEHLAECDPCRREFTEARDIVRADREREAAGNGGRGDSGAFRWVTVAGLAMAAVLATVLLVPRAEVTPDRPSPLRSDEVAGPGLTQLASPEATATMREGRFVLDLRWDPAPGEVSYRVTVTDAQGGIVAEEQTSNEGIEVDLGEGVESGDTVFWYVDATLLSGESATTGVQTVVLP